jgi:BON domain
VRNFNKLALIVVLGTGFAVAQSTPASPSTAPSTAPSTSPSSTTQPATPEQQPSTAPAQGTIPANAPETLPSTDQKKDTAKMPQSDVAPAANGDVQGNIQSAIQKDPSLASASVNVVVNAGKSVELTGTVPTKVAKDAAERIAKENSGGLKIKNHLKIAAASTVTTPDKPKTDISNPKL